MDQALKPYRISFDFKRVPRRLIVINFLLFFDFCVFLECIQSWFGVIQGNQAATKKGAALLRPATRGSSFAVTCNQPAEKLQTNFQTGLVLWNLHVP